MKIHLFSVLEVDAQCWAEAVCSGSHSEQWSVEDVKLQAPGGRNLLYLFEDRDVAPLATSQILELPKAVPEGTWEVPCSRACCWFCGERIQMGTNQSHAGVLTPLFQSTGQDLGQPPSTGSWRNTGPRSVRKLKTVSLFPANPGI